VVEVNLPPQHIVVAKDLIFLEKMAIIEEIYKVVPKRTTQKTKKLAGLSPQS